MISQGGGRRLLLLTMLVGVITAQSRIEVPTTRLWPAIGQFLNASSSVIVPETLRLEPGSLIGFSFRTCLPGELLKQKGDGPDELKLLLDEEGVLVLHLVSATNAPEQARIGSNLIDGEWHTVFLSVDQETQILKVAVGGNGGGETVLQGQTVPSLNLTSSSPQLHVGGGTMACISEGPGVHLSNSDLLSTAVQWINDAQTCLLPSKCSDYNWPLLAEPGCSPNFCENGGVCLPQSSLETPKCLCQPGFTGPNCATTMSSCAENPCLNGAQCSEDLSGGTAYKCHCPGTGHQGRHCEMEKSSCNEGACENGGKCYQQPGGRLCECQPSYTGMTCAKHTMSASDPCFGSPCQNGSCHPTEGEQPFTCMCNEGFEGSKCEVDLCDGQQCPSNSRCIKGECQCLPGFTQENPVSPTMPLICQEINECSNNPCQHGGTCVNGDNTYICQCRNGFTGLECEIAIDYCKLNQVECHNGGVCHSISETASIMCRDCNPGFGGKYCNETVSMCHGEPCVYGQCLEESSSEKGYECQCSPGYGGLNCEEDIDECESNPCVNGGTCVNGINAYSCACPENYTGKSCSDEDIDDPCVSNPCEEGNFCLKNVTASIGYTCKSPECDECPGIKICGKSVENGMLICLCPDYHIPRFADEDCTQCDERFNGTGCQDCAPGWEGDDCKTDIDECKLDEKKCNNGICLNSPGTFQCFCRPGFGGENCETDFQECLSNPCENGGTCKDDIDAFICVCPPGYRGDTCEIDIDECQSNPCQNNATCIEGIASYTCNCQPGFTGHDCEVNIDECEDTPCKNDGKCNDGVASFTCNCDDTGFEGPTCEINIQGCDSSPCQNGASCVDGINDYICNCYGGYEGKNCEVDIQECLDQQPCEHEALCFEKSNSSLYDMVNSIPENIQSEFVNAFTFAEAEGYVCSCMPGYKGKNCEEDINECATDPCVPGRGTCKDLIAKYECICEAGYEGKTCETEINECERDTPCAHGTCIDGINDYTCNCETQLDLFGKYQDIWGGKNCSVELIACRDDPCMNNGRCQAYLENGVHQANCTCSDDFAGKRCEHRATFSLNGDKDNKTSYIIVSSEQRPEGYELSLWFRTSLSHGLIAYGRNDDFFFSLGLNDGSLSLNSSLITMPVKNLGDDLNNTEWQSIHVSVNRSTITLNVAGRLQATQPINPQEPNSTVFSETFLGGYDKSDRLFIPNGLPPFIGCFKGIKVNDEVISEDTNSNVNKINANVGCDREDQCDPNRCQHGACTDLWNDFSCVCSRPYLGDTCQYNYTAGTFGYEDIDNSIAIVNIDEPEHYASGVDISMFIRTRKEEGFIFYFGSDLAKETRDSYITGELEKGNLVVKVFFKGNLKEERFQMYTVNLSDGNDHFIRVVRMNNSMMVKVNENTSINHEIPSPTAFVADKIYLGNYPKPETIQSSSTVPPTVSTTSTTTTTLAPSTLPPPTERVTADPAPEVITSTLAAASPAENSIEVENPDVTLDASSVRRAKRSPQQDGISLETTVVETTLSEEKPYFKGIIQDVQISNGKNIQRIVEFFKNELDIDSVPESIGKVQLVEVEEGAKSDDTCKLNPCQNSGTCDVTWNDYECFCAEGWKGRNCLEKEYCFWDQCPEQSRCQSLADGRECISDATFNGINSTLLAKPKFTNANATDIKVMFRSRSNGTLLQIVSAIDDKFIRLTLEDNQIRVDVPEKDNEMHNYTVSINNEDGRWHTITVRFDKDEVAAYIDDKVDMIKILTIDSTVNNLSEFVEGSKAVIVGSSLESKGQNLAYNLESAEDTTLASEVVDIFSESWETQYRGCMQELRIAGVLVPFFTPEQLGVNKPSYRFDIETVDMVETAVSGCTLCYEHECQNGASCAQPQELYECACQKGYEGETCAVNTDECTFHQCENGICLDGVANYTCECETGWTGWLCNEDFDECTDKPCLNDGICTQTDEPGNYTCECTEQYRGHNCEQLKNRTCEDNPCRNNAVCQNMKNNVNNEAYSCDCEPLYEGVDCQDKRDFCKESWDPCKNGATCTSLDSVLTYSCKCQPGYTGDTCEDQINECEVNGNPCNGGQCIDKLNEYSCNCNDTGFSGDHCQFDINECEKFTPCQNGNCENTNGGYFCECDEDFCGTNCQRQNPCTTIQGLCKNEGQCKESCDEPAPYYDCVCTEEWEGRNCTIKKWSAPTGNLPPNPVFDGLLKIVAPVVAGLLVLGLGCLVCLVIMVRKKRSGHGTYNPQKQEINGHRFEMTEMEVLKMPNEERLI